MASLQHFPNDLEQYSFMRDSLIYGKKTKFLDLRCYICNKEEHVANDCFLAHHVVDKEKMLLMSNFSLH